MSRQVYQGTRETLRMDLQHLVWNGGMKKDEKELSSCKKQSLWAC
jgi:hypothetical protein